MKYITLKLYVALFFGLAFTNQLAAQQDNSFSESLANVCLVVDNSQLEALFDNEVELVAPSVTGTYQKTSAVKNFSQFIAQEKPTSFKIKHQGTSGLGQVYAIAQLATESGITYKVVIRARDTKGSYRVFKIDVTQL